MKITQVWIKNLSDFSEISDPQSTGSFLQSIGWGKFQVAYGTPVVRYAVEIADGIVQLQGQVYDLPLGKQFIYFPRTPQLSKEIFDNFLQILFEHGFVFARFDPAVPLPNSTKFKQITMHARQPSATMMLDVHQDEATLLDKMHKKTRYNIRLANKKGVTVKWEKNMPVFMQLLSETTDRDDFKGHDAGYYQHMLEGNLFHQVTAYLEQQPIASNILVTYGDTVTYLHGTSSNQHRNVMAPYILQWESMRYAQKLGMHWYDLWGVAPASHDPDTQQCSHDFCWDSTHAFSGITRFKAGFGGKYIAYPSGTEVILQPSIYTAFTTAKKIRKLVRR